MKSANEPCFLPQIAHLGDASYWLCMLDDIRFTMVYDKLITTPKAYYAGLLQYDQHVT